MDAHFFNGLAEVVSFLLNMAQLLVFASIVVSWVGDRSNQIVQMIHNITEPMYRPFRKLTSQIPGPFDWSPIAVILVIIFLQASLVPWLKGMGRPGF